MLAERAGHRRDEGGRVKKWVRATVRREQVEYAKKRVKSYPRCRNRIAIYATVLKTDVIVKILSHLSPKTSSRTPSVST